MEFLASLAIKALIGTSICGAVTVGTIYKCDKTLLGFKDNSQIETGSPDNDNSAKSAEGQEKGEKGTGGASDGVLSSNLEASVSDNNTDEEVTEGEKGQVGDVTTDHTSENTNNSVVPPVVGDKVINVQVSEQPTTDEENQEGGDSTVDQQNIQGSESTTGQSTKVDPQQTK